MTFNDVIEDIKKLIGLDLQSIRPGANIRILEVDEEHSCLLLQTSVGTTRSRPLGELQLIWNEMNRVPAVHVDEVLHGSGTSRNQPETILANLPYVEWLRLDNKKHIAFLGKKTHPFGTLKQMDSIEASNLRQMWKKSISVKPKIVIASNDIAETISSLNSFISGTAKAISQGIYEYESSIFEATVLSATLIQLTPGTYSVLSSTPVMGAKIVQIGNKEFYAIDNGCTRMLVEK